MPKSTAVTLYTDWGFPSLANDTQPCPANGTANVTVKAAPGHLHKIVVTAAPTTTTASTTVYDSAGAASGQVLAVIPNNSGVGTIITPDMPAMNGIVVGGNANCPGLTIGFA